MGWFNRGGGGGGGGGGGVEIQGFGFNRRKACDLGFKLSEPGVTPQQLHLPPVLLR